MNDLLAFFLVCLVIAVVMLLAFRKFPSLSKKQLIFISFMLSPFVVVQAALNLVEVVVVLFQKLVLLLGGVELSEFEKDMESLYNSILDKENDGDE